MGVLTGSAVILSQWVNKVQFVRYLKHNELIGLL
jgi:hypothetical protein